MFKSKNNYVVLILLILTLCLLFSILKLIQNQNQNNNNQSQPLPTLYLSDISEISWSESIVLIQTCQIKTIFQKRNREVTLTDKNNRVYKTKEPKLNDIIIETNRLRSDCNEIIQTITE